MTYLDVQDLFVEFDTDDGIVNAVNGLTYRVDRGETVAIVGESGSGKSVGVLALMGLLPKHFSRVRAARATLGDHDLLDLSDAEMHTVRGREMAMVFQDPMTSLHPLHTVGAQIAESLRHHLRMGRDAARRRAIELLELVGIPGAEERVDAYPHQLSGGMRQRVMIAMALACDPKLLIADEPTTALDVTIQDQIAALIKNLQRDLGMSVIWITHDLGVVAGLADRVLVMYAGRVVEQGRVTDIYESPAHPYTKGLLASLPRLDEAADQAVLPSIPGSPPDLTALPPGCPFAERCSHTSAACMTPPPVVRVAENHTSACQPDVVATLVELSTSGEVAP